jgi:prepilin peptidase CpaA
LISLTLYLFGLVLVIAAAGLAILHDVRAFKIPNHLSLLAGGGFVMAFLALWLGPNGVSAPFHSIAAHLTSATIMFILTLGLFAVRLVGAGDAKFATALALWLGPLDGLPLFIFYMSLAGGLLGLMTLLLKHYKPFKNVARENWLGSAQAGDNRVPYGVAITMGFMGTLLQLGYADIGAISTLLNIGGES